MGDFVVGLLGLIAVVAVVGYGLLLFTSSAVLFSEVPDAGGFTCKYFTGTRVVEVSVWIETGCKRIISVGQGG